MKSTYSVIYIVSLGWPKGCYELRLEFPAPQEGIEDAIEIIECYEDMPTRETIEQAIEDTCDDEASIVSVKRLFTKRVARMRSSPPPC